jgi:16S rRNA (guanine527-N7)-methyltransferase
MEEIKEYKLKKLAEMIFEKRGQINLTGFKNINDIYNKLVMESIEPLMEINVPRGTSFADIGSGSGIPGIPIGIMFDQLRGTLVESNSRKAGFISDSIHELGIGNLDVICGRVEDIASEAGIGESFDWIFSRAFHNLYISIELGSYLVRLEGYLYIYSDYDEGNLNNAIIKHSGRFGMLVVSGDERKRTGIREYGYLFKKNKLIHEIYPRRFAVIKRESRLLGEET